ncbi:phospholipid-translocating P-type ATPase [Trametes versicolor FP-101664 SS1]|uniref:phospholipid-translocating P-type ATPase n=1 Tax=Trametes versicolor (strain FP-101664) TaxID=717944 RepID=UPI0004621675|nr:phospholipid-translocating P-type ATPase [Trametes versicolor FP-101664 SS1]EIW54583.1 phospholipid-translocating P-type ATPase [Trametes versicolor FP-101664 SS1]
MSDDFVRLVSQANPASRQQYQPANGGYPPSSSPPHAMDPFFDDDDDVPDSAFGRPAAMQSKESGLPLARSGAPPAGFGNSQLSLPTTIPPDSWSFDDDQPSSKPFTGSASFPGPSGSSSASRTHKRAPSKSFKKRLGDIKWPWQRKEKVLTGNRVIALNNPEANAEFCNNYVSTSKYNLASFVPKFLLEQFSKYANLFFLFTALIQQIPDVSPTNQYTTIAPLAVVLLASAFKETQEDLRAVAIDVTGMGTAYGRRSRTHSIPHFSGTATSTNGFSAPPTIARSSSKDRHASLSSSPSPRWLSSTTSAYATPPILQNRNSISFRVSVPVLSLKTYSICPSSSTRDDVLHSAGVSELISCACWYLTTSIVTMSEMGIKLLYKMMNVKMSADYVPLPEIVDVSSRYHCWLEKNHYEASAIKLTHATLSLTVRMLLPIVDPIDSASRNKKRNTMCTFTWRSTAVRLMGAAVAFRISFVSWPVNTTRPYAHGVFRICAPRSNNWSGPRGTCFGTPPAVTSSTVPSRRLDLPVEVGRLDIAETLGLTRTEQEHVRGNKLVAFQAQHVADRNVLPFLLDERAVWPEHFCFARVELRVGLVPFLDERKQGIRCTGDGPVESEREVANEFLTLLAVCHTVIPEVRDGKMHYQASSPDEAALVAGAEILGYQFHMRKPKSVFVNMHGTSQEYEILNVCEFNSTRKRMSTVVRCPDGKIKLFCKGADTVILERLSENQPFTEKTLLHLEDYATDGLRTLCIACRDIPEAEYRQWVTVYDQAAATINGRGDALDNAAELIERDMFLLGATAIEDKLQEGVPDTIHTLQMAGIKVWVLTGDRQETAINIGMACRLISESMNLVIVNEETAHETEDFLTKRLNAIKSQRNSGDQEDLALVIDGKSLTFALEKDISKIFLELAILCKAVICCRVSPLQKALVVKLVKKNQKSILLAIGDGANDVSMIQAAHVGVGISGVEGLQAARAADVAISQFRYLKKLLLVHGAWSYTRLSKMLLYSFYKNIVLYMTQFWFSFFNNFSGQIAYESWTLSLYNVVFTVLPPLVIGVFDQFVSARILDRYPQLYMLGQKNAFFTRTQFWAWVANALYHSIVLFGFSIILFWGDLKQASGLDTGHWFWGTTLYLAVLLTVLGKAALVSDLWTKYTVAVVAPAIGFSTEYRGIVPRLWTDAVFYFVLLLVPIFCLTRDFVWKYYRRTYMPETYHIAQEIQKYNIPDYRPRQEQFQKAIKKVRAVQRMRRNRGFAFSQTENAARQDQARLIRAYDTSKTGARPTGY